MGGHKQKHKKNLNNALKEAVSSNYSVPARNLRKADLGAVIFGCTHNTINECMTKNLFGLPKLHYSYIKNIGQGLALFLFNYSDRKLHGIFEATSPGQMHIDSYAWIGDEDDQDYTSYPAQVRFCVRMHCQPLSEKEFKPIIACNYYESKLFYFELDHDQTKKLIKLFKASPVHSTASFPPIPAGLKWQIPGTTNLLEPNVGMSSQPENQHQTTNFSYASVLASSDTTAATGSSSIPETKWSELFKSEPACEATTDDPRRPQASDVYGGKNEFMQESTWEGSNEIANDQTWTHEVEWGQTWESNMNNDAKVPTDKGDNVQENTWEKSHFVDYEDNWGQTWRDEVEWGQTSESDKNPQAKHTTVKGDYRQENTCHFVDAAIDEAEWGKSKTWESDTNPQGETTTLKDDSLKGNTWEESEPIPTTTVDVEDGETSNLNGQALDVNPDCQLSSSTETDESDVEENDVKDDSVVSNTVTETSIDLHALVIREFKALKGSQMKQIVKINMLEQELVKSKQEIQQLRNRVVLLECGSRSIEDPAEVEDELPNKSGSKFADSVYIIGGHDGSSWLTTLDSYFPSRDTKTSLSPMQFQKEHASSATLNGELYHFGGEGSPIVESFNPTKNQWISRPSLFWKNIHVAGASIKDRLYVFGGANGLQCSSKVEYLDLNVGKWLPDHAMLSKRLAPAAVELNNALYVTGGFDGVSYSSSVERYDPRQEKWNELPSMHTKKGCHSMVVLNEKLYTLGGFDGCSYVSKVEYLDTRMGSWVEVEPMNVGRGYFGAFVMEDKLYAIGGVKEAARQLDIVEFYKEGSRWEVATELKAIGKRSHFSAIVM